MARANLLAATGGLAVAMAITGAASADEVPPPPFPPPPRSGVSFTAPPGFEDLTGPQQVLLDVYIGGARVGEATAVVQPGHFRFLDARALVDLLPDIADRARLVAVLGAPDLDPRPEAVCPPESSSPCPSPRPEVAAIVYDAARYRVDIIVDPRFLTVQAMVRMENLPPPEAAPAMVNFLSGTVSGGQGQPTQYFVQDRAVVGIGTGRLRATVLQASGTGFQTDTLAGELDRPGLRYTAGAFWIPGNTLLDRVKMVGAGLASQFDTRLDRDRMTGSPLILFLDQRSRVDILVNGRIMASRVYDGGNQALDTSALPEGSYTVVLRVTPGAGGVREEQRFFSRSSTLPVMGHDTFFAYAGVLVRDSEGLVGDISRTPLFQAGWAHRQSSGLAVNLGVIGTDRRQWANAGFTVLHAGWQLDTALHVSDRGGIGLFGHLGRTGTGRLSVDLDARHISNPGGGPLLATTTVTLPASGGLEYTPYFGAYTQLTGAVGYRIGQGRLALVGTYRRQEDSRDYAFGPTLYMSVLRRGPLALDFNGSYTDTSAGRRAYAGFNLTLTRPRTTYTVTGAGQLGPGGRGSADELQGGITVSRRIDDMLGAQVQADGGVRRTNGITYADAQVQAHSPLGDGNLNLVQPFADGGTQFGASINTALLVGQGGVRFSEGSSGDAMVVVHVDADEPDAAFEVVVNNRAMGTTSGGRDLTVTLPSYRAYAVRIRGTGPALSDYDAAARQVSLYPGNVVRLEWRARPVAAVFGRLVGEDGAPLVHADVTAGGDLAQSDERGHFLIQTSRGATLTVRPRGGAAACTVTLGAIAPVGGYADIGDQTCRPISSSTQPKASP